MAKLAITPAGADPAQYKSVCFAANLIFKTDSVKPTAISIKRICKSIPLEDIKFILQSEEFTAAMIAAGVPWDDQIDALSTQQMMAIQVMANPLTGKSIEQRLRMAGVTSRQWDTWKKSPIFRETWERLSFNLLTSHEGELKTELLRKAFSGSLEAIKYIHELTGQHTPQQQRINDMQTFVQTILEIIQTEVTDQATLQRISTRVMAALAPTRNTSTTLQEMLIYDSTAPEVTA